jgi:hypothetical protein
VVPATTRPSLPWAANQRARMAAPVEVEGTRVVEGSDHGGHHRAETASSRDRCHGARLMAIHEPWSAPGAPEPCGKGRGP